MKIIKVKKSNKEEIYKLALEEDKILQRYFSQVSCNVRFTKDLFEKMFNDNFGKNKTFIGIKENNKIVAIISGLIKKKPQKEIWDILIIYLSQKIILEKDMQLF